MELRQFEYFLAVVDHGGMNRAAAALRVAQPSLSQAVRRLEAELGTELFHRVGRGLVLAPAGEALVGSARLILREREAAEHSVRTIGQGHGGRIDVAALSDMSTDPLSVWVARFCARSTDIRFRIEERDEAGEILDLVRSGACEIGFLPAPLAGDLVVEELVEQTFVLACPPGTESFWPDPTPIAALGGVPLVMSGKGEVNRDFIERSLRSQGVEPRVVIEVPQRGAVVPMVLAGAGAAVIPLRIALDARLRGAAIRQLDPMPSRRIGVVHRGGRLTPSTAKFLAYARASIERWRENVERNRAEGLSLVAAAGRASDEADERVRGLNLQHSVVRPHLFIGKAT